MYFDSANVVKMMQQAPSVDQFTRYYMDMADGKLISPVNMHKPIKLSGYVRSSKSLGQYGTGYNKIPVNVVTPTMQAVNRAQASIERLSSKQSSIKDEKRKQPIQSQRRTAKTRKKKNSQRNILKPKKREKKSKA